MDAHELHVYGVLPGERARVRVEHASPHAPKLWGSLVTLEGSPSPERVPPLCPGHGRCGGCILQHLAYPAQLTEKRRRVERELARHPALAGIVVEGCVASPRQTGYRNKAQYVLAAAPDGRVVFGSYAPASHSVVDMAGCQVPEPPIDEVARQTARLLSDAALPVYDEQTRQGELRYLAVRVNDEGEVLVVVVTRTGEPRPALARVAEALLIRRPEVVGVVHHVNDSTGGSLYGRGGDTVLAGEGALSDRVGGVRLELSARAFFQVNRVQAARLYEDAAKSVRAARNARLVDLFCGVGGIALTLASRGARVIGVETHAPAIEDATRSARAAGLGREAHFLVGDAATGLPAATQRLGGLDGVVVNPPRKGLGAPTRAALKAAAPPRLVYVSCNPATLADDLADLVGAGWRIERVRPYDLMPGTPHVETVVSLIR